MTDALLPRARSVAAPPRPRAAAVPTAATGVPKPLIPAHLGVYTGLSVAGYAICLAAVTGLQASDEARIAAERAPIVADLHAIQSGHDALIAELGTARDAYGAAASGYDRASTSLADYQAALAALSTAVGEIDGVSRAMPASYTPPKVTRSVSSGSVPASSTTGGSAPKP